MKNRISSILFIGIMLYSCGKDNSQLYIKYISQFNETNHIINQLNTKIYKEFEMKMDENPQRTEKWYNYARKVKNDENKLLSFIDSLQMEADSSYIIRKMDITSYGSEQLKHKIKLKNTEINSLLNKLNNYKVYIISIVDDRKKYARLIDQINNSLSKENLNGILTTNSNSISLLKLLALFSKLKIDILSSENNILSYLNSQTDLGCCFCFHKIEAIAVSNSQILPLGIPYSSELYLGTIDTTEQLSYEIDGTEKLSKECKGYYTHEITEKPGVYTKIGNFNIKNKSTGKIKKIPFKIEYVVLEKK